MSSFVALCAGINVGDYNYQIDWLIFFVVTLHNEITEYNHLSFIIILILIQYMQISETFNEQHEISRILYSNKRLIACSQRKKMLLQQQKSRQYVEWDNGISRKVRKTSYN